MEGLLFIPETGLRVAIQAAANRREGMENGGGPFFCLTYLPDVSVFFRSDVLHP